MDDKTNNKQEDNKRSQSQSQESKCSTCLKILKIFLIITLFLSIETGIFFLSKLASYDIIYIYLIVIIGYITINIGVCCYKLSNNALYCFSVYISWQ